MSPEIEGFVVTPLNPLFSARPLIVSNKKVNEVNVLKIPSGLKSLIILDGNQEAMLENSNYPLVLGVQIGNLNWCTLKGTIFTKFVDPNLTGV